MSRTLRGANYSIAAVSKLTGVSCHALRVWERRYGFPMPHRSESGHRRYEQEEVGILRDLARLVREGRSIGELIDEYRAGKLDTHDAPGELVVEKPAAARVVDRLFAGETAEADALLDRLAGEHSTLEFIERVIEPALVDIGERWFRGECGVFQEHAAVGHLFVRLGRILDQVRRRSPRPTRLALVGAVQGDRHEGGVLMAAIALELAGWRSISMGVDLPVSEYRMAIEAYKPDALGLSFVLSRNINKRFQELSELEGLPVFVGGRSIVNHQGLARRHGLIPLVGPLSAVTAHLIAEAEEWDRRRDPRAPGA